MEIKMTPVSRCLEKRILVFGFEIPDLLIIFITLSILNFLFGTTSMKIPLVWVPTIAIGTTLRLTKRGKPDNFFIHWIRFQIRPGVLSAFQAPTEWAPTPKIKRGQL